MRITWRWTLVLVACHAITTVALGGEPQPVAATITGLLGEDYLADVPTAARAIGDMIVPTSQATEPPAAQPLHRIAFGSCATQARPQPIWDAVVAARPELTLLLGDNIYADTLDMNIMRAKYAKLAAMPGFQLLRKTCPILATWDDHDLGANDAGGDYPKKDESQKIFLDFFGDPADSPRRHRPGVYDAKVFGPEGKRVQVIMLDTRYFRSPLKRKEPRKNSDPYEGNPDPTTTISGRRPVALARRAAPYSGRSPAAGLQYPGRGPGPRFREVDELSTRTRAVVQCDSRVGGRWRDYLERRSASGGVVDDGCADRLSDL